MNAAVVGADAIAARFDEIAALVAGAFPPGGPLMDAPFLRWALLEPPGAGSETRAALVLDGSRLAGFAAAAPWPLALDGMPAGARLVSFVSVAPESRGKGVARKLYEVLLADLAQRDQSGAVITFALHGTIGSRLIEECYAASGWTGVELETMHTWGTVRGRMGSLAAKGASFTMPHRLHIATDRSDAAWIRRDPRCVMITGGDARITNVPVAGRPGMSIGVIDSLPAAISPLELRTLVSEAERYLPPAVDRIVFSSLPAPAADVAAAAGLRRMPSAPWRAWVWATTGSHPFLAARSTSCPIT